MNSQITSNSNQNWHTNLSNRNGQLQALVTELRYHCDVYKLGFSSIQKIVKHEIALQSGSNSLRITSTRKKYQNDAAMISQKRTLDKINRIILKAKIFIHGYSLLEKSSETIGKQNESVTMNKKNENEMVDNSKSLPMQVDDAKNEASDMNRIGRNDSENGIKGITSSIPTKVDFEYSVMQKKDYCGIGHNANPTHSHVSRKIPNNKDSQGKNKMFDRYESKSQMVSPQENLGKFDLQFPHCNQHSRTKRGFFEPNTNKKRYGSSEIKMNKNPLKLKSNTDISSQFPGKTSASIMEINTPLKESKQKPHERCAARDRIHRYHVPPSTITNNKGRKKHDTSFSSFQYTGQRFISSRKVNLDSRNACNMRSATWINTERIDGRKKGISKTPKPITTVDYISSSTIISEDGQLPQRKKFNNPSQTSITGYYEGKVRRVNVYPENDGNYYEGNRKTNLHHRYSHSLRDKFPKEIQTYAPVSSEPVCKPPVKANICQTAEPFIKNLQTKSKLRDMKATQKNEPEKSFPISQINFVPISIPPTTFWEDPRLKKKRPR